MLGMHQCYDIFLTILGIEVASVFQFFSATYDKHELGLKLRLQAFLAL